MTGDPAARPTAATLSLRGLPPILAAVFGFAAGCFKLRAYDAFWHLAAGRWILEHLAVPVTDPFRWASGSVGWTDHEWLFQVVLRLVETAGGVPGIVLVRALAMALLGALLYRLARRRGAPPAMAALVSMAAVLLARPRFMARPELATLVFLPILLLLLESFRRDPRARRLVPLVLLAALWSNFHPGALLAPVLAGIFLLASLPSVPLRARTRMLLPAVGVPVLLAACLAVNPYGWRIYLVPFEIREALHLSGAVNPEWLPTWQTGAVVPLAGSILVGLGSVLAALRLRRESLPWAALGLAGAALGLSGIRHQGVLFILAVPVAASLFRLLPFPQGGDHREAPSRSRGILATAGVFFVLAAAWIVWPPPSGPLRPRIGPYTFGVGLEPGRFPVEAAGTAAAVPGLGPLYNDVAFGGYLIWRFYPERKVFLDGRNEVDPARLREVAASRNDSRRWQALFDRYGLDGALVRYDERPRQVVAPGAGSEGPVTMIRTTNALLFPPSRFALVYWDDTAMLYVRRTPDREAWLAGRKYQFLHPEDWRYVLHRAAKDPAFRAAALAEAERRLASSPPSRRAAWLAAALRGRGVKSPGGDPPADSARPRR